MMPEDIPFEVDESRWGLVNFGELECPGVFYLSTSAGEYYAVLKDDAACIVSHTVMAYGIADNGVLYFPVEAESGGSALVRYEIRRYLQRQGQPFPALDTLHTYAVYHADEYPSYFGPSVPPAITPRGFMTRYRKLENGIFLVETDKLNVLLALSYPIWDAELQKSVQEWGEQTEYDRTKGIDRTLGWLFFPKELAAVPFYELLQSGGHDNLKQFIQSPPAMVAAIWKYWPEYAIQVNLQEQAGLGPGNALYHLLKTKGIDDPDLRQPPQDLIPFLPDQQDTDFLALPDSW